MFETLNTLKNIGITFDEGSIKFINDLIKNKKKKKNLKIDIWSYLYKLFPLFTYNIFIKRYVNNYFKNYKKFDVVYSQHETLDSVMLAYYIAKKINKPFIILLQLEPYRYIMSYIQNVAINNFHDIVDLLPEINLNYAKILFYQKLSNSKLFKGFLSVSIAPLKISKLNNIPHIILDPGNAFQSSLLNFRKEKFKKNNYAVYFGRLSPEKGIYNLPYIWEKVLKIIPQVNLFIFGKGHVNQIKTLKKHINILKLNKNIVYKGFIPDQNELYSVISKGKVFIYPSYSDAFPLGVLESLAVGTPVVSYNIPAISSKYSGFKSVKIVDEGDINAMGEEIIKLMNLEKNDYCDIIDQQELIEFLIHQSSWKNVVENEVQSINKLLFNFGKI